MRPGRVVWGIRGSLCAILALVGWGCDASAPETAKPSVGPPPLFVEVSESARLTFHHHTGATGKQWFPESYCGGVAVFDADADGDLDVYCVQSGPLPHERHDLPAGTVIPGNMLFENQGDGTFRDVTARAGVGDTHYGIAVACGDYDNDGHVDLYVLNLGPNVLYRNNGDGTFTDVTARTGVGDPGNGVGAAFFDYDADGRLDLYVVNYIAWTPKANEAKPCYDHWGQREFCSPLVYDAPQPDTLYHNRGDGTFEDVSQASGIGRAAATGMAVVTADLDGDGREDVYVTNDAMSNQLWINNGDGTFRDEALLAGCAVNKDGMPEGSMGAVAADYDLDGDIDLFMPHIASETHTFYRNEGGGVFQDVTTQVGLDVSVPATGFGSGMFDYDHDGLPDLFISNGRVDRWESTAPGRNPYAEHDTLLRQTRPGYFEDVTATAGPYFQTALVGRGVAFGDMDNDGDIDAIEINSDGPVRYLRNECITAGRPADGTPRHWLMVKAVGTRDNRDAIGAQITLVADGRPRRCDVRAAYSYAASNDLRVHFGLGATDRVDDIVVRWPDGSRERFGPTRSDRLVTVRQGDGTSIAHAIDPS